MATKFIAVVCGLKSEAAAIRRAIGVDERVRIGVSGANPQRASALAVRSKEQGARALLSIGISGGLDPILKPGSLIVTSTVIALEHGKEIFIPVPERTTLDAFSFDSKIRDRKFVEEAPVLSAIYGGKILGSDEIIQTISQKKILFKKTNAIAVDMESHAVADAALRTNLPFRAIRAVADPASRALPPAALGAVAPDGSTRVFKTLLETAKAPGQFPALLKLGSDSEKALKTLRRDLGPIFRGLFLALDL